MVPTRGAVVDHVLRLRSIAEPGTTITSEPTAEMLVGLVGRDVSIVPLGEVVTPAFPRGASIFGLTRPGAEHASAVRSDGGPAAFHPAPPEPSEASPLRAERRAAILDALQHPSTLVALTVVGLALIFLLVLSPELGMAGLGSLVLGLGAVAFVGMLRVALLARATARCRSGSTTSNASARPTSSPRRSLASAPRRASGSSTGSTRITSDDGDEGATVLDGPRRRVRRDGRAAAAQPGAVRPSASPRCSPTSPRRPTATA